MSFAPRHSLVTHWLVSIAVIGAVLFIPALAFGQG